MKIKMVIVFLFLSIAMFSYCQKVESKYVHVGKFKFGSATHPGANENEIFLLNVSDNGHHLYADGVYYLFFEEGCKLNNFDLITWKTKRLGVVAYDTSGVVLKDYKPVFVKRKEFRKNTHETETMK
jgi:hypothetical protein